MMGQVPRSMLFLSPDVPSKERWDLLLGWLFRLTTIESCPGEAVHSGKHPVVAIPPHGVYMCGSILQLFTSKN